jgi:hypothetical protein
MRILSQMKTIAVISLGLLVSVNCIALSRVHSVRETNLHPHPGITEQVGSRLTGPSKDVSPGTARVMITIPRGG